MYYCILFMSGNFHLYLSMMKQRMSELGSKTSVKVQLKKPAKLGCLKHLVKPLSSPCQ